MTVHGHHVICSTAVGLTLPTEQKISDDSDNGYQKHGQES